MVIVECNKIPLYETLNLLICADSCTDTKTYRDGHVTCNMSGVSCCVSLAPCHLSLVNNFNLMRIRVVHKHPNTQTNFQTIKKSLKNQMPENVWRHANISDIFCSLQSTGKRGLRDGTNTRLMDIPTYRLNPVSGPIRYKSVIKSMYIFFKWLSNFHWILPQQKIAKVRLLYDTKRRMFWNYITIF